MFRSRIIDLKRAPMYAGGMDRRSPLFRRALVYLALHDVPNELYPSEIAKNRTVVAFASVFQIDVEEFAVLVAKCRRELDFSDLDLAAEMEPHPDIY